MEVLFLLYGFVGTIAALLFVLRRSLPYVVTLAAGIVLLPIAPFFYAIKAWQRQPKWLIATALLCYCLVIFLLLFF